MAGEAGKSKNNDDTLNEEELGRVRRHFFVGDVHGCADELQMLAEKIKFEEDSLNKHGSSQLTFVGDLIGKGPKSKECLQWARERPDTVDCVMGNHDLYVLYCARTLKEFKHKVEEYAPKHLIELMDQWRNPNQTESTLSETHLNDAQSLNEDDIRYLCQNMPLHRTISDQVFTVHAGLSVPYFDDLNRDLPWLLNEQEPKCLLLCRDNLTQDPPSDSGLYQWSQIIGEPSEGSIQWGQLWKGPAHCFYGHDARRGLTLNDYASGLDTCAVYGKSLTAAMVYFEEKSGRVVDSEQSVRRLLQRDGLLGCQDQIVCPNSGVTHALFSVESRQVYKQPGKKKVKRPAPAMIIPREFWTYSGALIIGLGVSFYVFRRWYQHFRSSRLSTYI